MYGFSSSALEILATAAEASDRQLRLRVNTSIPEDDFSRRLGEIAGLVADGSGGHIELTKSSVAGDPATPALAVECNERRNLTYLAAPEGPEAQPFLELMIGLLSPISGDGRSNRRQTIDEPADIQVFIAAGCPSCPHAVRSAVMIAAASPVVALSVIDALEFPGLAERWGIKTVPTTVIDGEVVLTGVVPVVRLTRVIHERKGPDHERRVLQSLLEAGRFGDAATELATGRLSSAFAHLWRHSTMEQRIRLMLAAENALEHDASCLIDLAPSLLPALRAGERALRGDTADLLGKIGNNEAREELRLLQHDPDPEIREAAAEALSSLES